jgi:acetyltransferase-like isoleucine patch superfamily enzyme
MKLLVALILFAFPSRLAMLLCRPFVNGKLSPTARCGFSLVLCDTLALGPRSRIGHFNIVRCRRVVLRERGQIGHMNRITGPFSVHCHVDAAVGNRNEIVRAPYPINVAPSLLSLGVYSKLTTSHYIDLTRSIRFGDYSVLAGRHSEMWTHSYFHAPKGLDRFRADGGITVGNNVYIGSASIVTAGATIADAVIVGAGTVVSKPLTEPGVYVSQQLRHFPRDYEAHKSQLVRDERVTAEAVYRRSPNTRS